MLTQIMVGLIGIAVGVAMVVYARAIVGNLGTSATAERYLGGGGTYTALRIGGILIIFFSFFYMTGLLERVIVGIGRAIFGG